MRTVSPNNFHNANLKATEESKGRIKVNDWLTNISEHFVWSRVIELKAPSKLV